MLTERPQALPATLPEWETASVAAPADLEALVRAELREPVAALVRKLIPELVAEQVNGHGNGAPVPSCFLPPRLFGT